MIQDINDIDSMFIKNGKHFELIEYNSVI